MKTNKIAQSILIAAPVLATLFINPYIFYDPFNVTRLFVLSIFGFAALFLILNIRTKNLLTLQKPIPLLLVAFVLWLVMTLFLSGNNKTLIFFGVSGRNTGTLAYLSLSLLMLLAYLFSSAQLFKKVTFGLLLVSLLAGIYGLLQFLNLDPVSWNNPDYSPVFGFFGNPNFHSAFMAICLSATVAMLVKNDFSTKIRIGLVILSLLVGFNIVASKSQQGILAFGLSTLFLGFSWLVISKKSKQIQIAYLTASFSGILIVIMDLMQKLPWGPFLYTRSISERGVTWKAGWQMFLDHPIFGIGLDQYRDYFRYYKDPGEFSKQYVISNSTSSHNILLDLASGGGFILVAIYIAIIISTLVSIYRVIKRTEIWNPYFVAISGAWIAYQAQSMVSINQLALAVWGWIFSGLIIGYEIHTREKSGEQKTPPLRKYASFSALVGALLGLSIGVQPLINDYQYRQNLKTGNVQDIQKTLKRWPQNDVNMILMARMLREANLPEYAYPITQNVNEFNPRYFEGWVELSSNTKASDSDRNKAKQKWYELYPSEYPAK